MKRYKDELRETKVRTRHFSSNCLVWDVIRNKSPMTQTSLVKGVVKFGVDLNQFDFWIRPRTCRKRDTDSQFYKASMSNENTNRFSFFF